MNFKKVNWQNGMRIDKDHFISLENYLLSHLYKSNQLLVNPNRYGIMRPGVSRQNIETGPEIKFTIKNVSAELYRVEFSNLDFLACSMSGAFISVTPESFEKVKGTTQYTLEILKSKLRHADPVYLILQFNPHTTIPFGNSMMPESSPFPVLPYRVIKCEITHVIVSGSMKSDDSMLFGENHFPIARLLVENDRLIEDEGYIPPCFDFGSHYKLIKYLNDRIADLSKIEENLIRMISNLNTKQMTINQKSFNTISLITRLMDNVTQLRLYLDTYRYDCSVFDYIFSIKALFLTFFNNLSADLEVNSFFENKWKNHIDHLSDYKNNYLKELSNYKHYDINNSLELASKLVTGFLLVISGVSISEADRDHHIHEVRQKPPQEPKGNYTEV